MGTQLSFINAISQDLFEGKHHLVSEWMDPGVVNLDGENLKEITPSRGVLSMARKMEKISTLAINNCKALPEVKRRIALMADSLLSKDEDKRKLGSERFKGKATCHLNQLENQLFECDKELRRVKKLKTSNPALEAKSKEVIDDILALKESMGKLSSSIDSMMTGSVSEHRQLSEGLYLTSLLKASFFQTLSEITECPLTKGYWRGEKAEKVFYSAVKSLHCGGEFKAIVRMDPRVLAGEVDRPENFFIDAVNRLEEALAAKAGATFEFEKDRSGRYSYALHYKSEVGTDDDWERLDRYFSVKCEVMNEQSFDDLVSEVLCSNEPKMKKLERLISLYANELQVDIKINKARKIKIPELKNLLPTTSKARELSSILESYNFC